MSIKVIKTKRSIKIKGVKEDRYILALRKTKNLSEEEFIARVSESSSAAQTEVQAVLQQLKVEMKYSLTNGYSVNIPWLGTFSPAFVAQSSTSPDDVSAAKIKKVKTNYLPSKRLKETVAKAGVQIAKDINLKHV